ncbi:hypothetical protein CAQUA_07265 [Corynebacterium aquatimens]|nr:hypothetical protein CAQUA_07265 [Corynebacterium aquatimens]
MRRGLACAVVPALMLTGCTKIDSESSTDRLKPRNAVTIAANPASEEQMVLAEIYRQVLELADRQVGIVGLRMDTSEERLEALRQNDATLTVVCTGAVAESMNRAELKEIVASEGEDGSDTVKPMSEDMVNAVYDVALATFARDWATVDPSPAEACSTEPGVAEEDSEGSKLPQNVIPVFNTNDFDRGERGAMNAVTRALNTEDLNELVEESKKTGKRAKLVNEWMMKRTGMGSELPRLKEGDPEFQ